MPIEERAELNKRVKVVMRDIPQLELQISRPMALSLCQKSYVHIWAFRSCRGSVRWVKVPGNANYHYADARRKRS